MPNTKSAIRRIRRVKQQTQVNRIRKSKYRLVIRQMDKLILDKKKKEAIAFLPKFYSQVMKIAKTGAVNRKTASRKISRLSKKINQLK
tara:strand:- start:418 stop:681 length:264 start_codon:yes stop_codon:yes gene_type:complete